MDKPSARQRLEHICKAILLIQSFVKDQTRDDFLRDIKGQNATLYQFVIIGEAIRHLDNALLESYKYPWHLPRSFRNFIAHEYHKIKLESVYNTATNLSPLLKVIETILKHEF